LIGYLQGLISSVKSGQGALAASALKRATKSASKPRCTADIKRGNGRGRREAATLF
jgi:hypothetical protein